MLIGEPNSFIYLYCVLVLILFVSGVGLGICKRILEQFSLVSPTDSNSQHSNLISNINARGLRLILACRSKDKATNAIHELKTHLNEVLISRSSNENVNSFISLLELQFECLDLSSVESCKIFSDNLRSKYKSLSSIICNAGNGSFTGIDWISAIKQVVLHPVDGLTYPNYKLQSKGEKTDDNLGWVFQTNIFGHFVLIKELQSLLEAEFNNYGTQSSVLWMSSLEAGKFDYDISDFQLLNNDKSYECSKYLTEALAIGLNDYYSSRGLHITSYIVHPGVVWSSIFYQHLGWILDLCMAFAFYLVSYAF